MFIRSLNNVPVGFGYNNLKRGIHFASGAPGSSSGREPSSDQFSRANHTPDPEEQIFQDLFDQYIHSDQCLDAEEVQSKQRTSHSQSRSPQPKRRRLSESNEMTPFRPLGWKIAHKDIDRFLFAHRGQWFTFDTIATSAGVKYAQVSQYLTALNDIEDDTIQSKRVSKIRPNQRKREVLAIAYRPQNKRPTSEDIR